MTDMDPEAAAEFAQSDPDADAPEPDVGDTDELAGDLGGSPSGGPFDRLKNTSPNPPISQVGDFQQIRENYASYGLRGIEKLAGADDAWAGIDLLKAALGATLTFSENSSEEPDEREGDVEVDGEF